MKTGDLFTETVHQQCMKPLAAQSAESRISYLQNENFHNKNDNAQCDVTYRFYFLKLKPWRFQQFAICTVLAKGTRKSCRVRYVCK